MLLSVSPATLSRLTVVISAEVLDHLESVVSKLIHSVSSTALRHVDFHRASAYLAMQSAVLATVRCPPHAGILLCQNDGS